MPVQFYMILITAFHALGPPPYLQSSIRTVYFAWQMTQCSALKRVFTGFGLRIQSINY
jgi:hypothetical protein